jgi:hypothetical protein
MYDTIDAAKHAAKRARNLVAESAGAKPSLASMQKLVARAAGCPNWHQLERSVGSLSPAPDMGRLANLLKDLDPPARVDLLDLACVIVPEPRLEERDHLSVLSEIPATPFLAAAWNDPEAVAAQDGRFRTTSKEFRYDPRGYDAMLYAISFTIAIGDKDGPHAAARGTFVLCSPSWRREEVIAFAGKAGAPTRAIDFVLRPDHQVDCCLLVIDVVETKPSMRSRGLGTEAVRLLVKKVADALQPMGRPPFDVVLAVGEDGMPQSQEALDAAEEWIGRPDLRHAIRASSRRGMPFHVIQGARRGRHQTKSADSTRARASIRRRTGRATTINAWPGGCSQDGPFRNPFSPPSDLLAWMPPEIVSIEAQTRETDWLAPDARSLPQTIVLVDQEGCRTSFTHEDVLRACSSTIDETSPFEVALRNLAIAYPDVDPMEADDVGSWRVTRHSPMVSQTAIIGGFDQSAVTDALYGHVGASGRLDAAEAALETAAHLYEPASFSRHADDITAGFSTHLIRVVSEMTGESSDDIRKDRALAWAVRSIAGLLQPTRTRLLAQIDGSVRD